MSGISKVFENLKAHGKAGLIGYVMGGDPEPMLHSENS